MGSSKPEIGPKPLNSQEVADLFGVDSRTVVRWSNQGRIPFFRTLGGHRRFHEADVMRLLKRVRGENREQ